MNELCSTMADNEMPCIPEFYAGKSIFITGATGFMGKVLVEKLLRSCPKVKVIYILLRQRKDQEPKHRLEKLLQDQVFDRVKAEHPECMSKIVSISGDLTSSEMGMSKQDQSLLINDVSVVFHLAATVRFDEKLKIAVSMNVLGTKRLLEMCHQLKQLEALIHVSTAYCNCDRKEINEIVYDPPVPPHKLLNAMEWLDDDVVEEMTPTLLGKRPNTYTYTKALAETLVVEEGKGLPTAICRPSIVTAAWKEPFPGWIDNYNGITGIIVAASKGLVKAIYLEKSCGADLIPVDIVINEVIAVAWYTACYRPKELMVYTCSSGCTNKLTWGELGETASSLILQNPVHDVTFYPHVNVTNSRWWKRISVLFFMAIPCFVIDSVATVTGNDLKLMHMYKKLDKAFEALEYFFTREWTFHNKNSLQLFEKLSAKDKTMFNFDIQSLHWPTFLEIYIVGIRKYLLKEDMSLMPADRNNLKRLYLYTKLGQLLALLMFVKLIIFGYFKAGKVWFIPFSLLIDMYSKIQKQFFKT